MDRLNSTKDFLIACGLHGFGIRAFTKFDSLAEEYKYLFGYFIPSLEAAIKADDPEFDHEAHYKGVKTEAVSTQVVENFIREQERDRVAFHKLGFLRNSQFYKFLYEDDGPGIGGPLPDLIRAFQTDNPEWSL